MKNCQLVLVWAVLAVLDAGNGLKISLSALKPDLELLREYWLQNPSEHHREGRILFPSNTQILVRFGARPNGEFNKNDAWKKDSEEFRKDAVQLINIQSMYLTKSSYNEPYYKHGTFYMPNAEMHNLTEPLLESGYWVEMLPVTEVCDKPYVEIRYIDVNSLGRSIDVQLLKANFGNISTTLKYGQNEFSVEYTKDDPVALLRFVRVIEFSDIPDSSESSDANYEFSVPYYLITYDWNSGVFSSVLSDQMDGRSAVRTNVGVNYSLRDCQS